MKRAHVWVVEYRYVATDPWRIWASYFDRYEHSTGRYLKTAKAEAQRIMKADREFYTCKFRLRKYESTGNP